MVEEYEMRCNRVEYSAKKELTETQEADRKLAEKIDELMSRKRYLECLDS